MSPVGDFDIFGRITRRSVEPSTNPATPGVDPTQERYDAVPSPQYASDYKLKFTNMLPQRRISVGSRVIPAEVGDPCIMSKRGSLLILTVFEGIPFVESCP